MALALETAKRATCLRRAVGCVLLNHRGHVLSTGYNGVAAGLPHCNDVSENGYVLGKAHFSQYSLADAVTRMHNDLPHVLPAQVSNTRLEPYGRGGAVLKFDWAQHACSGATAASGQALDSCQAIHAEQNALLQCRDVWAIDTCYVTASPCVTCTKLLMNTSCRRIIYLEEYPHPEAKRLWTQDNDRYWEQLKL